jgi:hypothetical protein
MLELPQGRRICVRVIVRCSNARVAENLFRMATNPTPSGPTVTATIFWAYTDIRGRKILKADANIMNP